MSCRVFAIKVEVGEPCPKVFLFRRQKTMYRGKHIAKGDTIFVFDTENEGGKGLMARGVVTAARGVARKKGVERQVPRVSVWVRRTGLAKPRLGRGELRGFKNWGDERAQTELNFKFYRQATNKIVGISEGAGKFLSGFF